MLSLYLLNQFKSGYLDMIPSVPTDSVFKPSISLDGKRFEAGNCFIIKLDNKQYALTAHHLFGPSGGLKKRYTWEELTELNAQIEYSSSEGTISHANYVSIRDAQSYRFGGLSSDLAAFELKNSNPSALTLSSNLPKPGERVFLMAKLRTEDNIGLYEATITKADSSMIEYKYTNQLIDPRGTSGAPIINQNGAVIGMNLASAGIPLINWKGRANSALEIAKKLSEI